MLTERDLLETIEECKTVRRPTPSTCQLMASCYTILDHLFPAASRPVDNTHVQMYSRAPAPDVEESEFIIAAEIAGMDRLLDVLDEHMDCIRALYPKEYAAIIHRLKD